MNYVAIPGIKNIEGFDAVTPVEDRRQRVVNACCAYYKVSFDELKKRVRRREIVRPRQIAMYLLHKMTQMWCADIGKLFEKDHTTVLHSFGIVQDLFDTEEEFREEIRTIKMRI